MLDHVWLFEMNSSFYGQSDAQSNYSLLNMAMIVKLVDKPFLSELTLKLGAVFGHTAELL